MPGIDLSRIILFSRLIKKNPGDLLYDQKELQITQ